jgi:hypothetical protein
MTAPARSRFRYATRFPPGFAAKAAADRASRPERELPVAESATYPGDLALTYLSQAIVQRSHEVTGRSSGKRLSHNAGPAALAESRPSTAAEAQQHSMETAAEMLLASLLQDDLAGSSPVVIIIQITATSAALSQVVRHRQLSMHWTAQIVESLGHCVKPDFGVGEGCVLAPAHDPALT